MNKKKWSDLLIAIALIGAVAAWGVSLAYGSIKWARDHSAANFKKEFGAEWPQQKSEKLAVQPLITERLQQMREQNEDNTNMMQEAIDGLTAKAESIPATTEEGLAARKDIFAEVIMMKRQMKNYCAHFHEQFKLDKELAEGAGLAAD